jgi:hypothetical protein
MLNSINKLRQIALNKSAFESVEEHIDELIQNEKSEHQQGWQYRVKTLEIMKQQKKLYRELYQGKNNDLENLQKFIEIFINEEKNLQQYLKNEEKEKDNNCLIF